MSDLLQHLDQATQAQGLPTPAVLADPGLQPSTGLDQLLADGIGDMAYLAEHRALRLEPARLLPGLRAIAIFACPYQSLPPGGPLQLARYAAGKDYHQLLRKKLSRIGNTLLDEHAQPYPARACVDSAPINERSLAVQAELGWLGRNGLVLQPQRGSYFFLALLLTTAPLPARSGGMGTDRCGRCHACEQACPTAALTERRVRSEHCISYLTIEHQGVIPRQLAQRFQGWWYGCDRCQEVCPWNRFAGEACDGRLRSRQDQSQLLAIGKDEFDTVFAGRAIRRIGYARFRRNLLVALWSLDQHQAYRPIIQEGQALVIDQAAELGITD